MNGKNQKNEKIGLWWIRLSLETDERGKQIQAYFPIKRKQEVEFWVTEKDDCMTGWNDR